MIDLTVINQFKILYKNFPRKQSAL